MNVQQRHVNDKRSNKRKKIIFAEITRCKIILANSFEHSNCKTKTEFKVSIRFAWKKVCNWFHFFGSFFFYRCMCLIHWAGQRRYKATNEQLKLELATIFLLPELLHIFHVYIIWRKLRHTPKPCGCDFVRNVDGWFFCCCCCHAFAWYIILYIISSAFQFNDVIAVTGVFVVLCLS